ncbi:MAG: DUF2306 domain-containing protein [Verrucomicrobiales bacterium]|nr:DUF2306 domain-containing protein [Verrucomicrobiales bacterium]
MSGRGSARFLGMKSLAILLLTLLSVVIAASSLRYFLAPDSAPLLPQREGVYRTSLLIHAGAASVALAVGPFQFMEKLRRRSPRAHRQLGYVYFAGVFIGGTAGLFSATGAGGGLSARTGFFLLGLCWLVSAWVALAVIRRGDVAAHRCWMIRNFALTFAAVTLRLWLPAMANLSGSFLEAYRTVAWLCWVPNAVVAEILLSRGAFKLNGGTRRRPREFDVS